MSEENTALGQLSAMKARYTKSDEIENGVDSLSGAQNSRLMAPQYWRAAAILLAVFCGIFLSLAYRESKGLSQRRSELQLIESRLTDGESRLMKLSTEIGIMTAQKESLTSEILKLRSEAGKNAESSAESRLLGQALPPLKDEYSSLIAKVASLRKSKTDLEGQVKSVEEKLANIRATFESQDRRLQSTEKDLSGKSKRLAEVEKELAEKQAAVAGASRSLGDYQNQLESTKSAYEDLKRKLTELNTERAQLAETMTANQAALSTVRENYTVDKSRLDILAAESKRLDSQINEDRKRSTDAEKKLRLLLDEVSSLETQRSQLGGLSKKISTAMKELTAVEADITSKSSKLNELAQKANVAEAALASKQSALDELEKRIEKLEATRLDLAKDISRMQGQQEILKQSSETVGPKPAG